MPITHSNHGGLLMGQVGLCDEILRQFLSAFDVIERASVASSIHFLSDNEITISYVSVCDRDSDQTR